MLKTTMLYSLSFTHNLSRSEPEKLLFGISKLASRECFPSSGGVAREHIVKQLDVIEVRQKSSFCRGGPAEVVEVYKKTGQFLEGPEVFCYAAGELVIGSMKDCQR